LSVIESIFLQSALIFGTPGLVALGFLLAALKSRHSVILLNIFSFILPLTLVFSGVLLNGKPDYTDSLKFLGILFFVSVILVFFKGTTARTIAVAAVLLIGLYPVLNPLWSDDFKKVIWQAGIAFSLVSAFTLASYNLSGMKTWTRVIVHIAIVTGLAGYVLTNGSLSIGQTLILSNYWVAPFVMAKILKIPYGAEIENQFVSVGVPAILLLEYYNYS
jgi:uncharacterized membrane protein